jgi:hypothetical protein
MDKQKSSQSSGQEFKNLKVFLLILFMVLVMGLFFFNDNKKLEISDNKSKLRDFNSNNHSQNNTHTLEKTPKDFIEPENINSKVEKKLPFNEKVPNPKEEKFNSSILPNLKENHIPFEIKMGNWAVTQGDVLLGKIDVSNFHSKIGQIKAPGLKIWENAEIPFLISPDYPYPELIQDVIDYFHENTPLRFVPANNKKDGIVFELTDTHCYSYLGKVGGFQPIFLSPECRATQIIHEILHAVGFVHEQARIDRDSFVKINWDNIDAEYLLQFMMVPKSHMRLSGLSEFNFQSIMLYDSTAFSRDNLKLTIEPIDKKNIIIPAKDELSEFDIYRIKKLYSATLNDN